jgi:hypothetical protein
MMAQTTLEDLLHWSRAHGTAQSRDAPSRWRSLDLRRSRHRVLGPKRETRSAMTRNLALFACLFAALAGCNAESSSGAPDGGPTGDVLCNGEEFSMTHDCATEEACRLYGCPFDGACTICPAGPERFVAYAGATACDCPESWSRERCDAAPGTFDCATREIAEDICRMGSPCHVCVQRVGARGEAVAWAAVQSPVECGCPEPDMDPPPSCTEPAGTHCCCQGDVVTAPTCGDAGDWTCEIGSYHTGDDCGWECGGPCSLPCPTE